MERESYPPTVARPRRQQLLPREVAHRLGPYYVYLLIDPRTQRPFYVGKGTRDRLLAHGVEADLGGERGQSGKLDRIHELRAEGLDPTIDIVRHGITTEDEAFRLEAALIDCLSDLTNRVAGHGTGFGRMPLTELVARYGAPSLEVTEPSVLMIRLTPRWKPMREELEPGYFRSGAGWFPQATPIEVFDAVRGWWKVNPEAVERRGVRHVVAVVEGVTRGIYEISNWYHRGDGRWAFTGAQLVEGALWERYVGAWGRRVTFGTHSQNPLVYWPLQR